MIRCDVLIVGSGFGGSILARVLRRQGRAVTLVERGRHPRFALGESSTPLANLSLERLARRYGLDDLHRLAAYGRWLESFPTLRRGLKRGFTFYAHRSGRRYRNGVHNRHRLLVAASPDDAVADSHWLREDVDRHLVERAVAEGVDCRDGTDLDGVERRGSRWRARGLSRGRRVEIDAGLVVDASGAGGFASRHLGAASALSSVALDTRLVFGHFTGARRFEEVAAEHGAVLPRGPYPDERAAVHHLLDDGWLYVLPFDHGVVSAGFVLRNGPRPAPEGADADPAVRWERLLARYPTLEAQFAGATPVRPIASMARVQHRLRRAAGRGWACLPHAYAFYDPLFSTGIAWTLLGVERLARVIEEAPQGAALASGCRSGLERYARLLRREADQMATLLAGAYRAMDDFALFAAHALLYFAPVSFAETEQRLWPDGRDGVAPCWPGFLGCDDPLVAGAVQEAVWRLDGLERTAAGRPAPGERGSFAAWVTRAVAPRDLAGFDEPGRRNLHPVDFDVLVERAGRMGLAAAEMRRALPRLRSL